MAAAASTYSFGPTSPPFAHEPAGHDIGIDSEVIPGGGYVLDNIYVDEITATNATVLTINGSPYPPPVGYDLVDDTAAIVDAVDPTIRITFAADGATGTTGILGFVQAADRDYTFIDTGGPSTHVGDLETPNQVFSGKQFVGSPVITGALGGTLTLAPAGAPASTLNIYVPSAGVFTFDGPSGELVTTSHAQTFTGMTSFSDASLRVTAASTGVRVAFNANGAAGTTATMRFSNATTTTYTLGAAGATPEILSTAGNYVLDAVLQFPQSAGGEWAHDVVTTRRLRMTTLAGTPGVDHRLQLARNATNVLTLQAIADPVTNVWMTVPDVSGIQYLDYTKTFTNGVITDRIGETFAGDGTRIDGLRFWYDTATTSALLSPSTANTDLLLIGSTQFALQVPANTATTGYAIGANAHNLQYQHGAGTHGAQTFASGYGNRPVGVASACIGGGNNVVNGAQAVSLGASGITINGDRSAAFAGSAYTIGTLAAHSDIALVTSNNAAAGISGIGHACVITDFAAGGSLSGTAHACMVATLGCTCVNRSFIGSGYDNAATGAAAQCVLCGHGNTVTTGGAVLSGRFGEAHTNATVISGDTNTITTGDGTIAAGRHISAADTDMSLICTGNVTPFNSVTRTIVGNAGYTGVAYTGTLIDSFIASVDVGAFNNVLNCIAAAPDVVLSNVDDVYAFNGVVDVTASGSFNIGNATGTGVSKCVVINALSSMTVDTSGSIADVFLAADRYFMALNDIGGATYLQDAPDDATAAGLGVVIGELYRDGSIVRVRLA